VLYRLESIEPTLTKSTLSLLSLNIDV